MIFAERGGVFPHHGIFQAPNVYSVSNRTHIMTKQHMLEWVYSVFSEGVEPGQKVLLIIDSWPVWKDHEAIKNLVTKHIDLTIKTIPAGCTGFCQPEDFFLFRPWKTFLRKINDFISLDNILIELHTRDNSVKLQSLIYNQFTSPRFTQFLKYSWAKKGYIEENFGKFNHLVKISFYSANYPMHCSQCFASILLKCAWCNIHLYFDHFFGAFHFHNVEN
jgi:hypothetical protein